MTGSAAMKPYEVREKTGGDRFYVVADTAEEASERVTRARADAWAAAAWEASPASPALTLVEGVVFDAAGRPIKAPEA